MRKDLTSQDRFIQNLTTSNRIGTLGLGLKKQPKDRKCCRETICKAQLKFAELTIDDEIICTECGEKYPLIYGIHRNG